MAPTLTLDRSDRADPPPRTAPALFRVLDGDAPLAASWRWLLDGVDAVEIGRAEGHAPGVREGRTLTVRVPDHRVSTRHAALERDGLGFALVDRGSKNGTRIDGAEVTRRVLVDGDVIELGRTFFVYRAALAVAADALDEVSVRPEAAGDLATIEPGLAAALAALADVAASDAPIVVTGESGTGKELIARAVHARSGRTGALVAVNCGALPDALLEAELFGHRKGAFSGALADREGLVRAADRGTLFLDEIGDLPLAAQAALLRVLQEREVVPVGATAAIAVDFRVVAATHRDLPTMVARGEFREDLYARLAGFTMRLPPLRARRQDLGLIIGALIGRLAGAQAAAVRIDPAAALRLFAHPWPRNVRELEKCLGTALALAKGGPIRAAHVVLDPPVTAVEVAAGGRGTDDELRARLVAALARHGGNVSAVARDLDTTRMQIHRWAKRFAIDLGAYR
ncbi:MAG: sigma 54-interacting transcriptional regulator [Deltaproteobacteria bacterium]|nr:sigma 54-interacting transcriptional regulator [Deltaproteobacteria bacterium]